MGHHTSCAPTYESGAAKDVYRGKHDAGGSDTELHDPREFLVRVLLQIPTPTRYA